jgi:hypothetical protein
MGPPERVALLAKGLSMARAEVAEHYDEVFYEVVERIDARGSVGKGDIAMLTVWKRLRANTTWVKQLLAKPESTVRKLTAPAVRAARTGEVVEAAGKARDHLWSLPGFVYGTALASAVLTAAAPTRLAVYDTRARRGLGLVGLELSVNPLNSLYPRYIALIEQCRAEGQLSGEKWSTRDVDLSLYMLGKPKPK